MEWIFNAISMLIVPALSPLVIGCIRTLKARFQNRMGADVFQPYRTLWKLFHKDEVVSKDSSWIFLSAPFIVFGVTVALAAGVPTVRSAVAVPFMGDFLVFVYMLAAGTFFLALAGMDTGGGFGGFGASREMMIAALAEGGLIFSLLAVALIGNTHIISSLPAALATMYSHYFLPIVLSATAFYIALLAENSRMPVDNPATHLELTMVHEAMILEYSGKRLALMEWAAANKLLIFIAVFVNVFFPWGITASVAVPVLFAASVFFIAKAACVIASIAVVESTMAKFRIFRVPDLLVISFIVSVIAILIIIV